MNKIRREEIRQLIEKNKVITLEQLVESFPDVSLMTIHRDLSFLQEQGFLLKVRGGARYIADSTSEPAFAAREILDKSEKVTIAKKAIKLLHGSNSIFIDAGTTTMALAKEFPNIRGNIITTGPNIALELSKHSLMTISLCGGVLNKDNLTLSGSGAEEMLSEINIDTAFLVASGYSADCGFTCGMEAEAAIKKIVIKKARTKIMLINKNKLDRVLPYTFANIQDFDYIVTDEEPERLETSFLKVVETYKTQIV